MSEAATEDRLVVGVTQRIAISGWEYEEIRAQAEHAARINLAHRAQQRDRWLVGEEHHIITFARSVREQHHEHGWQMVEQSCAAAFAEYVLYTVEQMTVPITEEPE